MKYKVIAINPHDDITAKALETILNDPKSEEKLLPLARLMGMVQEFLGEEGEEHHA